MEPLDEQYLEWLYSQVGLRKLRRGNGWHWKLLKQLYSKEFVWIIPNDDNRLEDGRDLRLKFIAETILPKVDRDWMALGCSMLEMLIALSERLEFETDIPVDEWFWELIENLNLSKCADGTDWDPQDVDDILDDVIWRTYEPDGKGGLFPLQDAQEDQRDVELWYQQSAYVIEQDDRLGV